MNRTKVLAILFSTSAIAGNAFNMVESSGSDNFISEGTYINEALFIDISEMKTNLISESFNDQPIDDPISIPTVKKMIFRLGTVIKKEFNI